MRPEEALAFLERRSDEAEVYFSGSEGNSIGIKKGEIEIYKEDSSSGYGVRAIKEGRVGFAFSNALDEGLLRRALKIAGISERDASIALPIEQEYADQRTFDEELASLRPEEASGFVADLVEPCRDHRVIPSYGVISWSKSEVEIWNTHGLHGRDEGTWCTAFLSVVAKEGDVSTGFYHDSSRKLDLDFNCIGEEAARLARDSLGAKNVGELSTNATLKPQAVEDLLGYVLIPSFSADNVQRKRSYLAGKLGEKLFGELSIVDDATLQGGLGTSKFDDEGVRSQRTALMEDGVLRGFLYDTYTARKAGTESTGNAERNSYASLPSVGISNCMISGKGGLSGSGLVVHGLIGAHTSNPVSGDFSLETKNAFLDGEPVKKAIISGNVFQLLKNIGGFGDDYRQVSSIYAPSMEFLDVSVVG